MSLNLILLLEICKKMDIYVDSFGINTNACEKLIYKLVKAQIFQIFLLFVPLNIKYLKYIIKLLLTKQKTCKLYIVYKGFMQFLLTKNLI